MLLLSRHYLPQTLRSDSSAVLRLSRSFILNRSVRYGSSEAFGANSHSRPTLRRVIHTSPHRPSERYSKPGVFAFLNRIPENALFYGIIGLNLGVFTMWYMATQKYKQERDPSAFIWMQKNFTNSLQNLSAGRIWTPLTSCFSHQEVSHILFNGFTFYFLGKPVLQLLGSRHFTFLYIGGGLISSFSSLLYSRIGGHRELQYSSHGASGAIYSVISLLTCVAPKMSFALYGIVPVPAWLAVTGLFAYDVYSTISGKTGKTDTVGHISGIAAGIGYFILRRIRFF